MAVTVRGINIEIGSNANKFNDDIKKLNSNIGFTNKQLRNLNQEARIDGKSTENLTKKQSLLGKAITQSTQRLSDLKQEQERATAAFEKGEISEKQLNKITLQTERAELELKRYNSSLNKTQKELATVTGDNFIKLGDNISSAGKKLAPLSVASAALIGSLTALTLKTTNYGDELAKTSAKVGITAEELQRWRFIADRSGVSVSNLEQSFKKLTLEAGKVGRGVSTNATAAFEMLGVSVTDVNGNVKNSNELFLEVQKALKGIDDEAIRTSLSTDIFGRSAVELNTILDLTQDEINELIGEIDDLGIISNEQAEKAEELADNMTNLKASFANVFNELAFSLMPVFTQMVETIQEKVIPVIKKVTDSFINLSDNTKKTIFIILGLLAVLSPVLFIGGKMIALFGKLINIVKLSALAFGKLGASINLASFGIKSLVAIVLIALSQNEKFRETIMKLFQTITLLLDPIFSLVKVLANSLLPIFNLIMQILNIVIELFVELLGDVLTPLIPIIQILASVLGVLFEILTPILKLALIPIEIAFKGIAKLMQVLVPIIKAVGDTLLKFLLAPINFIISAINFLIDGINALIRAANNIPFINIPELGNIDNIATDTITGNNQGSNTVSNISNTSNNIEINNDISSSVDVDNFNQQLGALLEG